MTEDELNRLADKIAARTRFGGTKDDLAQIIRDAGRRSIPPKTGAA